LASDEPLWFDPEDAIEINKVLVSLSGEEHLLRDEGLLISAVHRPRNLYLYEGESDVVALASSLLFAIARNHPFVQGNKRTAFAAALIFLENNGYGWAGPDHVEIAELMIAAISRETGESEFLAAFEPHVRPKDG